LEETFKPNSTIRSQDAARAFANIASSVVGRSLAFDFLENNFAYIKEKYVCLFSAKNHGQEGDVTVGYLQDF
jgi:hypothetical protein